MVRVRFVSADGRRAVGHEAKSAKGRLARAVLDGGLDAVHGFAYEGWRAAIDGDVVTVVAPDRVTAPGNRFLTEFICSTHQPLTHGRSNGSVR